MDQRRESLPYLSQGLAAGVLGAATVAGFFFVVDLLAGRPLATPSALGATLFLGEPFDLTRSVGPALVAGYTALHLGIFIGLAFVVAIASFGMAKRPPTGFGMTAGLTAVFFFATLVASLGFYALSGVLLWTELSVTLVLSANLLASFAMAGWLTRALRVGWTATEEAPQDDAARRRREEDPPIDPRQLQAPPAGRETP